MPHNSVRAVITDLDGTLLGHDKTISPRTEAALQAVRGAGFLVAAASSRPLRLVEEVLGAHIGLFDATMVSNGAAVFDRAGAVLRESLLPEAESETIIARLREHWPESGFGWELGTYFASDGRFLELTRAGGILRDPSAERVTEIPAQGVHQLVMAVPGALPRSIVQTVAEALGAGYTVTDSSGGVVEISSAAVSKAGAARWWSHSIGSSLADTVAFGDEHNDLSLIVAAGHGVAMGNAIDEVKDAADEVTGTNDDDGVAVVLERILAQA